MRALADDAELLLSRSTLLLADRSSAMNNIFLLLMTFVALVSAEDQQFISPAASEADLATRMAAAVGDLTSILPLAALSAASFSFAGPEHRYWHWIPAPLLKEPSLDRTFAPYGRTGVALEQMNDAAIERLHRLLRLSLSAQGYRAVELVLRREGPDEPRLGFHGLRRTPNTPQPGGPGWYFFTLFGTPSATDAAPWGWRLEGHHLSLTFEVTDHHVRFSPFALCHNPAPVPPEASTWGTALFRALAPAVQLSARLVATARDGKIPGDMDRSPGVPEISGAALGQLDDAGQRAYAELIEAFLGNFPEPLTHDLRGKLMAQAAEAHLAWYGPVDDEHAHFYRLQGPSFLIQVRHQGTEAGFAHVHTSLRLLDDGSVASQPK
jgi:Protein of unknown function (DUF3500)